MSKIVRSLVLMAAMAGLVTASGVAVAPAQDKKTDPKAKPADPKAAQPEIGKIQVYEAKDGWRWKVLNSEGKTVAMAVTGQDTKEEALKVIDMVKATLNKAKVEIADKK